MADNVYDTSGGDDSWDLSVPAASAPARAPAPAPYIAQVPGGASDSPFSFGGDPNQPGMFGMSRGFWRDVANFSANLGVAANARTAGGFLANGTGFAGPLAAATQETLAQGVKNATTQSEINARKTQTMGEGLKNAGLASGLPLLQFQNRQSLDFAQNPEHEAAWAKRQADAYDALFPPNGGAKSGGITGTGADNTGGVTPTPYSRSIAGMEGINRQNPEGSPEGSSASSARGTGQFIDSTWLGFFHSNPSLFPQGTTDQQALAMRNDPKLGPALGHAAINWLGTQNASALQKSGVDATGQSLGIAHWLGSTATAAVMKADDQTPVKDVLYQSLPTATADAYMKANPQLAGYTVGALKTRYANIPTPPFGTQTAGNGRVQVAQAGGAVPTQAQKNADAIVAGQTQAQTPGTVTAQNTPRQTSTGPEGPAAQKAAADAANAQAQATQYYNEAARVEQAQTRWDQMKAFYAARGRPFLVPRPLGDPASLRTMAAKAQQTAMDLGAAYPKTAAEGAGGAATHVTSDRPGSILHDANGNVVGSTPYPRNYTTPSGIPYTMQVDPVTDQPIISEDASKKPTDQDIPVGGVRSGLSPAESERQKQSVDLVTGDINQDRKTVEDENEHVIGTAQSAKLQALQLKRLAPEAFTGPMGDVRAIGRAYLQYFTPKFADYFGANADVAQEFKKIALMQAGSQERATLGAKGSGYRATELYLKANPGLDMNEVANGHMANLLAVQQQASIDYGTGASGFYEKSRNDYSAGNGKAPYQRVTEYDNRYNQVFNDQTYAAAMGAMNDRPEAEWSKGLNPRQIQAVVGIVQRTDPTAKFEMGGAHGTADDFIKRGALTITPEDIITEKYSINGKLKPKGAQ